MKRVRAVIAAALLLAGSLSILYAPLARAAESDKGGKGTITTLGWPNSMASTGDSITRAFNTGSIGFTDAPANSWSTGTSTSVNSHYSRILAANPAISGRNFSHAVSGARMVDLNGQVAGVNGRQVEYVTVLMGANDACRPTEAEMTPVATFRAQLETALNTLSTGSPDARIYVLSVPNIYNLWSVLRNNSSARTAWSLFGICQSMLANPLSTAQEDVDRRSRVNQRVVDFNTQLAQVCAAFIHCRFDNNAVYNTTFAASDVSTRDYFHPSLAGQARLAAGSYEAGFDFTDAIPPVSSALYVSWPPRTVSLHASDNVAVAGIEYRVNNGPYTRYTGTPIALVPGSVITYRAVDVNGNTEAWHSIGQ
jgi:lysophospholipase L1-like esterase